MPRIKSPVKKVRKNWQLPERHLEMLTELQTMLGHDSQQETLRYLISQAYHLESAIHKDGCWLVIRDKEGKERAIIFK